MYHRAAGLVRSKNRTFIDPDDYETRRSMCWESLKYKTLLRGVYEIKEETNTTRFKVKQAKRDANDRRL